MGFWKQLKEDLGLSLPPVKTDEAVLPVLAPSVPVVAASIPVELASSIEEILPDVPEVQVDAAPKRHGRKPSVPPEVQIERRRKKQRELKALQRSAAKQGKTVDQLLAEPARIRLKDKPSGLSDEQIAAIKLKTETRAEKNRQRAEDSRARKKAKRDAEKTAQSLVPVDPEKPRPPGNPAWVPGVSGNKEGRTKVAWFTSKLKELLTADPALQEKFIKACLDAAIKDKDIEFIKLLWDRLEGKQSAADDDGRGNSAPVQILFAGVPERVMLNSGENNVIPSSASLPESVSSGTQSGTDR